jgi:ribosome maturation factor RimP
LSQPFKVKQQYFKYVGKEVEIILKAGDKIIGKLLDMNDNGIKVEFAGVTKKAGKSKPQQTNEQKNILFNDIKSTKVLINF